MLPFSLLFVGHHLPGKLSVVLRLQRKRKRKRRVVDTAVSSIAGGSHLLNEKDKAFTLLA